ncbi:MAG: hypothetical protein ABIJ46_03680 [bacterium]
MRGTLAILSLGMVLALLQAATFSVLPFPVSLINLPLMVSIALVLSFRFRLAVASAALSGLVLDALVPSPAWTSALSLAAVTALSGLLVSRYVSHRSIASVIGSHGLAFVGVGVLSFAMHSVVRTFGGEPLVHPGTLSAAVGVVIALPVQCLTVLAVRWISGWLHGRLGRIVLVLPGSNRIGRL